MYEIIPAILVHHREDYINQLKKVEGLVDRIHIDIMDGKFVPNTSVTLNQIGDIATPLKRAAHLMVQKPDQYFKELNEYSFDQVIIHRESFSEGNKIFNSINMAKSLDIKFILALNPKTSEDVIKDFDTSIESLLIMTVEPGFAGQEILPSILGKIARISRLYPNLELIVDGGINEENIKEYFNLGVRKFSMASSIFKGEPKYTIANIKKILNTLENKI